MGVIVNERTMINRRVRKGFNRRQSEELLQSLMDEHQGINLAYALAYNGYATDTQAAKFVGEY